MGESGIGVDRRMREIEKGLWWKVGLEKYKNRLYINLFLKIIYSFSQYFCNISQGSQLQTEILKGIKAGADIYSLFLKATKAIALMTSNNLFYTQTEADIKAIYGRGLKEKPPLQIELKETEERLKKLIEAEQREDQTDSKERIQRAIKAHEAAIESLKNGIA